MAVELFTLTNPVFRVFLCHAALVLLKTCVMSILTAHFRLKNKAFANEEDMDIKFAKTKKLTSNPQVERVRRAHLNDVENVFPFVLLGFLFIATNPSILLATTHFRLFTVARLAHTVIYVLQIRQPFRAITFFTGFLVNVSMAIQVLLSIATF